MSIEEYFGDWAKVIDINEADKIMHKLKSSNMPICPSLSNVFKAFKLCPLHNLRVVIVGQDPYCNVINGVPVATGIAFGNSVETKTDNYSPSLDILKESVIDYTKSHEIVTFDPSLEKWEEQGVLLINAALSCIAGKTGSHMLLWRPFIKSLLINLSSYDSGIVFVLMGNEAQSFESCINTKFNHLIKVKHPAWYVRNKQTMPSDLWKEINKLLIRQNGNGIEWYNEYNYLKEN